jgi:hypothetical protein
VPQFVIPMSSTIAYETDAKSSPTVVHCAPLGSAPAPTNRMPAQGGRALSATARVHRGATRRNLLSTRSRGDSPQHCGHQLTTTGRVTVSGHSTHSGTPYASLNKPQKTEKNGNGSSCGPRPRMPRIRQKTVVVCRVTVPGWIVSSARNLSPIWSRARTIAPRRGRRAVITPHPALVCKGNSYGLQSTAWSRMTTPPASRVSPSP